MGVRIQKGLRLLREGRIPRLGQATAAIAVLVLVWLLFVDPAMTDPSSETAADVEVPYAVSVSLAPVDLSKGEDGRWRPDPGVNWTETDPHRGHFGFRQEPVWVRVSVANPHQTRFDGVVVFKFPYTDHVDFFGYDGRGDAIICSAGDSVAADPRLPRSHFPAFPIELAAGESVEVYLRIATTSLVLTPVYVYSAETFEKINLRDQLLFAALFGAVVAVCLYVVTVFLTVRDRAFLDFIMFSLAYALYVAVASGMGQTWVWPAAYENANHLFFVIQGLMFASGVRFFQRYLRTRQIAPRVNLIFRLLIFLGLLTSLTPLLPPIVGKLSIAFVAGPGAVLILAIAVFMAFRGVHRARIVAIGWSFSQISSVFIYLRIFDLTPYTPINHYLTGIGCAVATIFFAVALALGLRHQQEQLLLAEKLNETRASFMAGMSHELRTPLNAIMGFSEMIKSQMLGPIQPPIYQDYAADIYKSSRIMLDMVDRILDISRLESGEYKLNMAAYRLNEVLDEAGREMQEQAQEAGVQLHMIQADESASAVLDRPAIRRVLEGLISNAIRHSEPEGSVTVSARERPGRAEFVVEDRGEGMDPGSIEKLLIPYEAVRVDAYKAKSGAGLGLPLASALVRRHGGELLIDTAVGRGTTVTVSLPAEGV